jgi:hypothetical protein
MDGNENPCGEFGECRVCLTELQELACELNYADFATWRFLPAPHCQVQVPKVDIHLVYCPSLTLLDVISIHTRAVHCG